MQLVDASEVITGRLEVDCGYGPALLCESDSAPPWALASQKSYCVECPGADRCLRLAPLLRDWHGHQVRLFRYADPQGGNLAMVIVVTCDV